MKLKADPITESSLAELGKEAVRLLLAGAIDSLASEFGYGLSFGRSPSNAIQADLSQSLAAVGANALDCTSQHPGPTVRIFPGNATGVLGVVECQVKTDSGSEILLELVLTAKGDEKHLTLEQISAAA